MEHGLFPQSARSSIVHDMLYVPVYNDSFLSPNSAAIRDLAPAEAHTLWPTLSHLGSVYPGFKTWYFSKVVPGLVTGSRHILRVGTPTAPAAVAIVKRDEHEVKIWTLWVTKRERGSGLGRDLLEEAIDWCGTANPLFTVPAERFEEFKPLMRRFNFIETARVRSLYRPGVAEHIFNGQIKPTLQS